MKVQEEMLEKNLRQFMIGKNTDLKYFSSIITRIQINTKNYYFKCRIS